MSLAPVCSSDARSRRGRIVRLALARLRAEQQARRRPLRCGQAFYALTRLPPGLRPRIGVEDAGHGALRISLDGTWLFIFAADGSLGLVNLKVASPPCGTPPVGTAAFAAGHRRFRLGVAAAAKARLAELRRPCGVRWRSARPSARRRRTRRTTRAGPRTGSSDSSPGLADDLPSAGLPPAGERRGRCP